MQKEPPTMDSSLSKLSAEILHLDLWIGRFEHIYAVIAQDKNFNEQGQINLEIANSGEIHPDEMRRVIYILKNVIGLQVEQTGSGTLRFTRF